ncbi:MAG TPA: DMT family transporter [Usitatibacter sp.]|jgi:drug/metabolite transporter (DMT)-like permease|nr:DMT family transporter [Usitatibacter sp.]
MSAVAAERPARVGGAVLVAIAAIAFSGKAVIIKLAYRYGVDAVTLLALRMAFSAPLFVVVAAWAAKRVPQAPLARADARNIVILGIVGYYLSSFFDFLGLQYITAALERLLLFVHPTFVVLLSALLFGRRITGRDVAAILLSYLGIGLVFGNDVMTQRGNVVLGSAWVLLSALLYAIYLLGSGRLVHRVGTLRFASYAGLVSCVAVVAHYFVTRDVHVIFSQPPAVYGYGLLMAVVSTVLPIILTSEGIKRLGASHASIVGAVGPVATIFLGAVFLGEAITAIQLAGAGLVLAGVLAISLQKRR